MTGISWEQLRELAAFRADNGCAVSLYVNLDPSEAPTLAAVETRLPGRTTGRPPPRTLSGKG